MPFPVFETKQLNDEARRSAGGSFIQLPNGITHYELSNPESEQIVVFVHGFSVPYFIFDPTFDFVTGSGYRALRYDLFGRGFSDRPRTRYNIDLLINQLSDLLDALRIVRPVNLIGLSMGGPITATFAARHPERVKSLTLIDPAGVKPVSLMPTLRAMKPPRIADAIFSLTGSESMIESAARDFYDPEMVGFFLDKYKIQMHYKGFKRAILSSVRNNMLGSFIDAYKRVGELG
ncbi:MAG TPA: alpha/beta hydrolase, partial [Anaerolineales bacterium]